MVIDQPILALDLSTRTGWAARDASGRIGYGTERFTGHVEYGSVYDAFVDWLADVITRLDTKIIICERPLHRGGGSMVLFGLYALAQWLAWKRECTFLDMHVSTLKKYTTGAGNATKQQMIFAMEQLGYLPADDNQADALALLHYAIEKMETVK